MNLPDFQGFNQAFQLAIPVSFGLALIFSLIFTAFLYYHWTNYEVEPARGRIALTLYLGGTVALLAAAFFIGISTLL